MCLIKPTAPIAGTSVGGGEHGDKGPAGTAEPLHG